MLSHVGIVAVAGAAVWWAGTRLSGDADRLAESTGVDRVLLGALLLGVVTSLPEIATTITAGVLANPGLATGNLFGGVALQVVVLSVADVAESDKSLSFQVSRPMVLFQHVALMIMLAVAVAAMAVGEPFTVVGVGIWPLVLLVMFLGSLWLVQREEGRAAWIVRRSPKLGRGADDHDGEDVDAQPVTRPPTWRIVALGSVILVAGWAVARSGDALAEAGPVSGTFVGAVLVALTTSLPEVSTVLGALRNGAYDMAVSNIVGTNSLEVALLAVADVSYRDGPILAHTTSSDTFLAALAATLTGIYLAAMLLRREATVLRVGYDSAAVFGVYVAGVGVLAAMG